MLQIDLVEKLHRFRRCEATAGSPAGYWPTDLYEKVIYTVHMVRRDD